MNLQQTYDLLDKILKERPELANALLVDSTHGGTPIIAYWDTNPHIKTVTICSRFRKIEIESEVIVWQHQ
jgi:hypothetical protein